MPGLDPRVQEELQANADAEANDAQVLILKQERQIDQLEREVALLRLSVNGLQESNLKHQRLSAVRLARAQKAERLLEMQNVNPKPPRKRTLTNKEYRNAQDLGSGEHERQPLLGDGQPLDQ